MPTPHPRVRGFTLVEILIVVVVLGILSVLLIPSIADHDDDARRAVFQKNLDHFRQALVLYKEHAGTGPGESATGTCPPSLRPFMDHASFTAPTPLGGRWDIEQAGTGVGLAVGVHFDGTGPTRNDVYMAKIDAAIDDGDLTTGMFRRLADGRYYWVLEP